MPATDDNSALTRSPVAWSAAAREKLAAGTLSAADFDQLDAALAGQPRQRLLYIHAAEPSLFAAIVAFNIAEPSDDYSPNLDPTSEFDWPYPSVFDAMKDGWQVIQFPRIFETVREDEYQLDAIGHEFILQKIEVFHP